MLAYGNSVKFYNKTLKQYTKEYVVPDLPEQLPIPLIMFVDACVNGTGTPENFGTKDAIDLTRLLENSYISNRENRIVEL